jgi:hypothetical protein
LESPVHQYDTQGHYTVKLRGWNEDCAHNYYRDIHVQKLSTGINDLSENDISIFSFERTIYVQFDFQKEQEVDLAVYDLLGRNLFTRKVVTTGNNDIDLGRTAEGNYYVQVKTKEKVFTAKVALAGR